MAQSPRQGVPAMRLCEASSGGTSSARTFSGRTSFWRSAERQVFCDAPQAARVSPVVAIEDFVENVRDTLHCSSPESRAMLQVSNFPVNLDRGGTNAGDFRREPEQSIAKATIVIDLLPVEGGLPFAGLPHRFFKAEWARPYLL